MDTLENLISYPWGSIPVDDAGYFVTVLRLCDDAGRYGGDFEPEAFLAEHRAHYDEEARKLRHWHETTRVVYLTNSNGPAPRR